MNVDLAIVRKGFSAQIGREIVRENYTWKKVSADLIEYLSSIKLGRMGRK